MKPLFIILIALAGLVLLVGLLLLFGTASIRITCKTAPRVVARVLGIPITILSGKEPTETVEKDLSRCRNPDRALRKELRRRRKEAKKAWKKKQKAAQKAAKKQLKKQQKSLSPSPNLKENLDMITALVKRLYEVTRGKIKIRIDKMHLLVGTDDAAKTAILYGVILQSAVYLLQWIETHFTHLRREPGNMRIEADYVSGKCHADVDIVCSIRLYRALGIGLKMLTSYREEQGKAQNKANRRIARKTAA